MPRGRAPKKVNQAKRRRVSKRVSNRRAANLAKAKQIAEINQDNARSGSNNGPDVRDEGMTGRDKGILANSTKTRNSQIKDFEQSVGSLDRRVEEALKQGNTDLAKDLRSRQNKFTKKLGLARAHQAMINAAPLNMKDKIKKRIRSNPNFLNTSGFEIFQDTVDKDFLDSTRKLQNEYPDQYGEMYPITNVINKGPLAFRGIRAALGDKERKQIPYNLDDMPGVRYPLDKGPFFGGRSRDPNFDNTPPIVGAPTEDVIMSNIPGPDYDEDFTDSIKSEVLPKQFDVIDKSTRSEIVDETMGDLIDSGVQDFDELDKEFQEDSKEYFERKAGEPGFSDNYPYEVASNKPIPSLFNLFGQNDAEEGTPTGGEQQLIDALNADGGRGIQDELTSAALQSSGYNLNPNIIDQLFEQGFLEPGTDYFGSTNTGTPTNNPIVDAALASYYDSLN